ncbi:NUDIX domain-containing protein [Candidatus Woesebacteria bacterium]|nr:NUDIX domain-containing protein [Candidatus Woesebacteria bacterium]
MDSPITKNTTDNQDELFVVVDEQNNIVGYKTRSECHNDPSLLHRSVHVAVVNSEGKILLQKRSMTKDLSPGWYCISVGGHVEKGEDDLTTAVRELEEELGIKDVQPRFVTSFLSFNEPDSERVALFTVTHDGPFYCNKEEIEEVRLFDKQEIEKVKETITKRARRSLVILHFLKSA